LGGSSPGMAEIAVGDLAEDSSAIRFSRTPPGNAHLPISDLTGDNREIGVPRGLEKSDELYLLARSLELAR